MEDEFNVLEASSEEIMSALHAPRRKKPLGLTAPIGIMATAATPRASPRQHALRVVATLPCCRAELLFVEDEALPAGVRESRECGL